MAIRRVFCWLWVAVLLLVGPAASAQDDDAPVDEATEEEAPAKVCPKPDVVRVGTYVNNIQNLDLKGYTYEFDFYVWFKWCNPELDPGTTMEFLNPSELWGMMLVPNYEVPEELPDGSLYQVVRVQGKFSTKMPLYSYPFDRQRIGPIFEDSVWDTSELVYSLDDAPVALNPELALPGYLLAAPELILDEKPYPTSFGDTRTEAQSSYSRAMVAVPLSRPLFSQLTLLFAPVASVIVCAALMFVLSPALVDSRIGVGTTAMLTIVALQMTYNQELPDVGYLMLMDKVYLASYAYVLVGLGVVMATTPSEGQPVTPELWRANRLGLFATSVGYAVVCVGLCLLASLTG